MGGLRFSLLLAVTLLAACFGGPGVDPPTDRVDGSAARDAGRSFDAGGAASDFGTAGPPTDASTGLADGDGAAVDAGTPPSLDGAMPGPDAAPLDADVGVDAAPIDATVGPDAEPADASATDAEPADASLEDAPGADAAADDDASSTEDPPPLPT